MASEYCALLLVNYEQKSKVFCGKACDFGVIFAQVVIIDKSQERTNRDMSHLAGMPYSR